MSSIFVSYRRVDAPAHAGRIYDRLVERFGRDDVYMDLDSTAPGAEFAEVIDETIAQCDALLAVIGRDWLSAAQPGRPGRRLDDPDDWVRREIASALERGIRVVPVLVEGARMPTEAELPAGLEGLARRHAVELSDTAWRAQLDGLIDSLAGGAPVRPGRGRRTGRRALVAAVVVVCVPAIAAVATLVPDGDRAGAPGSLTADEYKLRVARICAEHEGEANQAGASEGDRPVLGVVIPLEKRTTDHLAALRPPGDLRSVHRSVLALWGRRLSVMEHYYDRIPEEGKDPDFLREFRRGMDQVDALSVALQKRFTTLGVTPECDFF